MKLVLPKPECAGYKSLFVTVKMYFDNSVTWFASGSLTVKASIICE
jgi:hypothetical protein